MTTFSILPHSIGAVLAIIGAGMTIAWDFELSNTKQAHCYLASGLGLFLLCLGDYLLENS